MDDNIDRYFADIHSDDDDLEVEEYYEEFFLEAEDFDEHEPVRIAYTEYEIITCAV